MAGLIQPFAGIGAVQRCFLLFCLLLMLSLSSRALAVPPKKPTQLLAQAQMLINQGEYEKAYALLEPHETRLSDILAYNYLYGIAALDSGRPGMAVFALQRALSQDPQYSAARMELARAYFELNDLESARSEFELLLQDDPPQLARTAIINYLAAINRRSARYRPNFSYYFQGGAGYDSNANGATDADQFLSFRLDERNVAQSSAYFELGAGASYSHPLTPVLRSEFQVGARHRRHPSADFVNLDRLQLGAGLVYEDTGLLASGQLLWSRTELDADGPWDGQHNNDDAGLQFGLRKQVAPPYLFLVSNLRVARVEYQDEISVQDVDQYLLSVGYEFAEEEYRFRRLGVALLLGEEKARESGSPYGRDQLGLRLYGSRILKPRLWLLMQGGVLSSEYDGNFFGERRKDTLFRVAAALDWRPFADPRLGLQPHLAYLNNDSDISLFEYDRVEIGITLRWASQ